MLLVDQVERQALADVQVAAVMMAAGAKGVEMPTVAAARRALDDALNAPLRRPHSLEETLGLRRAG